MMRRLVSMLSRVACCCAVLLAARAASAHEGPPFPIVSDQVAGAYLVSLWTDPDTTDDGTAGGQFWVMLEPASGDRDIPAGTQAIVVATPLDRPGDPVRAATAPVRDDFGAQFAALVLDHEGRFGVSVAVDGPLGPASVESEVDATYDLRPPKALFALYLMPFVLVGALWLKLLLRRRQAASES